MSYEELVKNASDLGLHIKEKPLLASDGRISGNKIAIRETLESNVEKTCILAEEMGHFYTTVGNIVSRRSVSDEKQELQARRWAYDYLLDFDLMYEAKLSGLTVPADIAEHIGVTEQFLAEALNDFKQRYGVSLNTGKYLITFDPFDMMLLPAMQAEPSPIPRSLCR